MTEMNAVLTLEAVERLLFKELPRGTDSGEIHPGLRQRASSPVNA